MGWLLRKKIDGGQSIQRGSSRPERSVTGLIRSAAPRAGGAQARAMHRAAQPIPRLRGMHQEQRGRTSRLAPQFHNASRPHPGRDVSFLGSDGIGVDRGGGQLRMAEPSLQ